MIASTAARRLLFLTGLIGFIAAASVGCSSPDGVSCDTDDDCFQNETCDGEICRTADNDPAPHPNNGGNGNNGGNDDNGENGENGENGDDAGYSEAPSDVDTDDHECLQDNLSCSAPAHANAPNADSYRPQTDDDVTFGCVSRSDEFYGHSETTDVFSLCRGDFHRYDIYLYSCMNYDFWVSANFIPETACWDGYLDFDVDVDFPNNEDLDCSSSDASCTVGDDGSFQVDIRIQDTFYSYEQPQITIILEDLEVDEIVFDYYVEFEIVEEL